VAARHARRYGPQETLLLRHAGELLRLQLAREDAERAREGVLRFLMSGDDAAARIMAPGLADVVSVVLVEGPPGRRDDTARACAAAVPEGWYAASPGHDRRVIAVLPARRGMTDSGAVKALQRACPGALIAPGGAVPVREFGAGYEQARTCLVLRRLALGTREPELAGPVADLAAALGAGGPGWARARLARIADGGPGQQAERLATLAAWLAFGSQGAADLLHVHRNALTGSGGRIPRIAAALGENLTHLGVRAELSLAVHLYGTGHGGSDGSPGPGILLAGEAACAWADGLLGPLRGDPVLFEAMRAWTLADGCVSPAAASAGVTGPVLRRRLARAEPALRMVLVSGGRTVTGRSAKYSLYLAFRALGWLGHLEAGSGLYIGSSASSAVPVTQGDG
jgi:hypothetical protein